MLEIYAQLLLCRLVSNIFFITVRLTACFYVGNYCDRAMKRCGVVLPINLLPTNIVIIGNVTVYIDRLVGFCSWW